MSNIFKTEFPFPRDGFFVELWESGNAPDYSIIYTQGVQAARGKTESYHLTNSPKGDPICTIEITGNSGSAIMNYNYIGIDFWQTGEGKKWYFVKSKKKLNYNDINIPETNWYAVEFTLELDVWETYKDQLGNPIINLEQVTTVNPGNWNDTTRLEQDIVPFSATKKTETMEWYSNWKTIVGWQSKKPTEQDNFIIDGMRTTLQFNETGELGDYLAGLEDLTTGSLEETQIWRSYLTCNTYVVSEYFSTENGGRSKSETLQLSNPPSPQIHNRLNYYPYKRAFIRTIDGQLSEIDYKRFDEKKLPNTINVRVEHFTLPQPTSVLIPVYDSIDISSIVIFSGYPTMDFVGKNITPVTQLTTILVDNFKPLSSVIV